jgi:protein PhnA
MSKGRDAHHAHQQAVAALGKTLTRRANSKCELCEGDQNLRVIEISPVSNQPNEEGAILACEGCRELIDTKRLPKETTSLRFLEGAVWADHIPVRVAAIQLMRRLSAENVDWANNVLESLWIDEDLEARLTQ